MPGIRAGRGFAIGPILLLVLGACGVLPDHGAADPSVLPVVERPQTPGTVPPTPGSPEASTGGAAATVTVVPTGSPTPTGTPSTAPSEPAPPTTSAPDDPTSEPTSDPPSERELLEAAAVELTNAERADAGCPAVHVDERLVAASRAHSEDMVERDFFDHINPDGETPWDRASAAGYDWAASENIAYGYRTAEAVVEGWMNSDGHRRNILDCDAVAVGVGVADSSRGPYWTQMFGRR